MNIIIDDGIIIDDDMDIANDFNKYFCEIPQIIVNECYRWRICKIHIWNHATLNQYPLMRLLFPLGRLRTVIQRGCILSVALL
jgi:hypothetical protein